jgi:hypothetical protein
VPELVREDDGFVETFSASDVTFVRNKMNICKELSRMVGGQDNVSNPRSKIADGKLEYARTVVSETNAKVTFCRG